MKKVEYFFTLVCNNNYIDKNLEKTINGFDAIIINNQNQLESILDKLNLENNEKLSIAKMKKTIKKDDSKDIRKNCEIIEILKKFSIKSFEII